MTTPQNNFGKLTFWGRKEIGLGKKFFGLLKDFLDHHVTYKEMYDEIQAKLNHKEDEANEQTKPQNT